MTVFKNYFKIVRGHLKALSIYAIIFIVLTIFSNANKSEDIGYQKEKANIYIEDFAKSDLSNAFIKYMAKENTIVDMAGKNINDNLFYGKISTYIKIPEDFDKKKTIEIKNGISNKDAQYVKEGINLYLDQLETYARAGFDEKGQIENTDKDFSKNVNVSLNKDRGPLIGSAILNYFNFLAYVLLCQIILVVSLISLTYNNKTIAMRNEISPTKKSSENMELLMGHATFALITWAIYMVIFIAINGRDQITKRLVLMIINSMVFTLSTVSLAVFLTKLIRKEAAVMEVMNIFALGSSFLTGVFVPQEILGANALRLGKIFPSFYYIANNNMLAGDFNKDIYIRNTLILIAFIVLFALIGFLIDKFSIMRKRC